jgi:hypothetical protein
MLLRYVEFVGPILTSSIFMGRWGIFPNIVAGFEFRSGWICFGRFPTDSALNQSSIIGIGIKGPGADGGEIG